MIELVKKSLLAALLVIAAGPAFGAGASATLSLQVYPAVGGIPCDIGPPSTGPIPAGAQAAGYTHCAFHSDFSLPFYTNTSNWLSCTGAANPQWFTAGFAGNGEHLCSEYSMVNDGGVQVLDMAFTAGGVASGGSSIITLPDHGSDQYSRGVDFPNGMYAEATWRNNTAAQDGSAVPFGTHISAFWTWSDTGQTANSTAFDERDFIETYATGCCHNDTGFIRWNGPVGMQTVILAGFGQPEYQIDNTVYHKIGNRVTQAADGSNIAMCSYLDGVFVTCQDSASNGWTGATALSPSELNARNYVILFVGPQSGPPVGADMHMYIKEVTIWTCDSWAGPINTPGHPCTGPVLTGPP